MGFMNDSERDQLIAELLGEGLSLSDVQKTLKEKHGLQITYMDLRLISSELEVDWEKIDPKAAKDSEKKDDATASGNNTSDSGLSDNVGGKNGTVVNVNKVVRPGAVMSGDVKFRSGATADWHLDPLGRLGLNPTGTGDKPTEEDLQEFQMELQKSLQGKM
jgi:hypothetical protein